ncbi:hypothetical protein L204_104507 [Cryptococcus depauperatus]
MDSLAEGHKGQDSPYTSRLPSVPTIDSSTTVEGDDYGFEKDLVLNEELERILYEVEKQHETRQEDVKTEKGMPIRTESVKDIEDMVEKSTLKNEFNGELDNSLSPLLRFRKSGTLSVSDLVSPIWCEVQYDYRLRTFPSLPIDQRPDAITAATGKQISVDKFRTESKEKLMKRGNKIHKRLEKEIYPNEVTVNAITREDVWGLRLLNMFSSIEALLTLGKCREFQVVGFIHGIMVLGIIDEITRVPVSSSSTPEQSASAQMFVNDPQQMSLGSFFSPTQLSPVESQSSKATKPQRQSRTHRIFISDSKTRAIDFVPREEDSLTGRLQIMIYKELLDSILLASCDQTCLGDQPKESRADSFSILPSQLTDTFTWPKLFSHLSLSLSEPFSAQFLEDSKTVIQSNRLRHNANQARCLEDYVQIWHRYVADIGLGVPTSANGLIKASSSKNTKTMRKFRDRNEKEEWSNLGRTEDKLELIYRRARGRMNKEVQTSSKQHKKVRRGGQFKKSTVEKNDQEVDIPSAGYMVDNGQLDQLNTALPAPQRSEAKRLSVLEVVENSLIAEAPVSSAPEELATVSLQQNLSSSSSFSEHEHDKVPVFVPKHPRAEGGSEEEDGSSVASDSESSTQTTGIGMDEGKSKDTTAAPKDITMTSAVTRVPSQLNPSAPTTSIQTEDRKAVVTFGNKLPAGTIIGRYTFLHSQSLLATHLQDILQFWMGKRPPRGVEIHQARRCGWCEFEEECEWRLMKIDELWKAKTNRKTTT